MSSKWEYVFLEVVNFVKVVFRLKSFVFIIVEVGRENRNGNKLM